MRKYVLCLIIFVSIFAIGCDITEKPIGGERDEYGCLSAAGYQWCPSKQQCMRMWEEYCEEYAQQFKIKNFEDCAEAGNPVMESYPRKCSAGGQTFVEVIDQLPEEEFCGTSTNGRCSSDSGCTVGGCSGQVCQSKNEEPVITICDLRECYNAENYGLKCKCFESKCQWA